MKLKLTKKLSGDTDGIIVMVEYGPEEEPKKKYIGKWNLGAVAPPYFSFTERFGLLFHNKAFIELLTIKIFSLPAHQTM